jgi:hypothetical protein
MYSSLYIRVCTGSKVKLHAPANLPVYKQSTDVNCIGRWMKFFVTLVSKAVSVTGREGQYVCFL